MLPIQLLLVIPLSAAIGLTASKSKKPDQQLSGDEQRKRFRLILPTSLLSILILLIISVQIFTIHASLTTPIDRVLYALRWEACSLLVLVIGIGYVATIRFFGSDTALNGGKTDEVDLPNRLLQNTLEQTVIGVVARVVLSIYLSPSTMPIVPALVTLFLTGRVLFYHGYLISQCWKSCRILSIGANYYLLCH
jgi:hypothetical protein